MQLSTKQQAFLRSKAHPLEATVQLGKQGASEGFRAQLGGALDRDELVKVRLGRHVTLDLAALAGELGAALVAHVGRMAVFYRPAAEPRIALPPD